VKKQYNVFRKQQADLRALLRGAVSAYLLYLSWRLAVQGGDDPDFPPAARILIGVLFAAGAIAFGVYTWKRYRADRSAAELTDEELAEKDESNDGEDA